MIPPLMLVPEVSAERLDYNGNVARSWFFSKRNATCLGSCLAWIC
jgi:hypothetical protein